jgi:hypothetical protein
MIACIAVWVVQSATRAAAQAPLRAAVFKTSVEQNALTPLAAALDPVLAEQLGKATQLTIVATPALDLPSLQLAVDCVGETPSCLALAAERSQADGVISPSLSRTETEIIFSLLLFDPQRRANPQRIVTKRVPREAGDSAVLSAAVDLVREVFGIASPPPPPTAEPAMPQPLTAAPEIQQPPHDSTWDAEPRPQRGRSLIAPISLGIVGAIGIGMGIAFGVASQNAEDAYAKQRVINPTNAARADERYDSASRSAMIADISFGVGAAALVAATIVWIVQRPKRDADALSPTRTRLALSPGHLSLQGAWQ